MKNRSLLLLVILFAAVLIFAAVLYPKLSEQYMNGGDNAPSTADTAAETQVPSGSADLTEQITEPKETEAVVWADDFAVYDMNMNRVHLSSFFGKPIVINFWASWCYPCKSELPAFENAYQTYGDDVVFLMVNLTDGMQETVNSVKAFLADSDYSFPVYLDTEYSAAMAYGIYSIPETVFIYADGSIHDIRIGAMSETVLNGYIEKLLQNK